MGSTLDARVRAQASESNAVSSALSASPRRRRHDDLVHASALSALSFGRRCLSATTFATGDATCTIRRIDLSNIRCQDTPSHHQSVIAGRESAGFERQCSAPTMESSPPPV